MMNIAIDGPSGAGKSTIAKAVAEKLHYIYVDTGALYRTIGWSALSQKIPYDNEDKINNMLGQITVDLTYEAGEQKMLLNGKDVSREIRLPESSMAASGVSALPCVRQFLLETQRNFAERYNVIMDGRDIGTVVLPHANVKIFLTAAAEKRARRRYNELCEKGTVVTYQSVLDELLQRDYNDSHRAIAPLKPAKDAILVDTTALTLEQSIQAVYDTILQQITQ